MQDFTFENLNILRYLFKSKQSIMRKIVPLERLCWEGRLSRWLAPPSGRAHPCAYSHLPTYIAYNVFSAKYNPTCQTLGTDIRGTCRWRRSGRRRWQSWGARRQRTWRSMYLAWSASGSSIYKLSNRCFLSVLQFAVVFKILLFDEVDTVPPSALVHEGVKLGQA